MTLCVFQTGPTTYEVQPPGYDPTACAWVVQYQDPFQFPDPASASQAFGFGLSVVLTFGLVGFLLGRLINFWR